MSQINDKDTISAAKALITTTEKKNLNIWANWAEQTVQTLIRQLLKEQANHGLHRLPLYLRLKQRCPVLGQLL